MKAIIVSKNTLISNHKTELQQQLFDTLASLHANGVAIITISKDPKPSNFHRVLPYVKYYENPHRQSKDVARNILNSLGCDNDKSFVLSTSDSDVIMASNSKLFSLIALWSDKLEGKTVHGMGIKKPSSLQTVLDLIDGHNPWFGLSDFGDLKIYSLTNAGDYNSLPELSKLKDKLNENLKHGTNTYHDVFRFLLVSSILKTPDLLDVNYWGFYPSSSVKSWTDELIYKYYEYAKFASHNTAQKHPLFIRFKNGPKRSMKEGTDRLDPNEQLETISLNPYYSGKLKGKKVAVIDDFVTNGTSFWVAYSLLKKAGVKEVRCIAMGKFGKKLCEYSINLNSRDPFSSSHVAAKYKFIQNDSTAYYKAALSELKDKVKEIL